MIFAFTVTAPPGLLRAGAEVRAGIARSAATELERTVSRHFCGMQGREYWRRAGDFAVAFPEQPGTVTVSQPGGVALHLYGGTVLLGARLRGGQVTPGRVMSRLVWSSPNSAGSCSCTWSRECVAYEVSTLEGVCGGCCPTRARQTECKAHKANTSELPSRSWCPGQGQERAAELLQNR